MKKPLLHGIAACLWLSLNTVAHTQTSTTKAAPANNPSDAPTKQIRVQVESIDVTHEQFPELMFGPKLTANDGKLRQQVALKVDNLTTSGQAFPMKTMTIAEFKRHLPALLGEVANGESIILQRGRKRENVAMLTPFKVEPTKARELGPLAKRGKPLFKNWSIGEDEFLASR